MNLSIYQSVSLVCEQSMYISIYLSIRIFLSVSLSNCPSIYPTPLIYVVQAPGGDSRDRGLRLPGLQCAQGTRDRVYHVESMTIIIRSEEKLYSRLAKLLPHVRNLCHVSHNCTFNITLYIHTYYVLQLQPNCNNGLQF